MDAPTRIIVVARPGHYRDSLIALLRAIPGVVVLVLDGDPRHGNRIQADRLPDIILVDPQGLGSTISHVIPPLRKAWPSARFVVLTESVHQAKDAQSLGIDCVLSKSTRAGEFISIITDLRSPKRSPVDAWPLFHRASSIAFE